MATDGYSIQRLTVHTWDAFAGLVERHNGIFGGCWCTYFHDCAERQPGYEGSRAFKKLLVEAGQAHAALVMVDEEAFAWAEYGTPDELPNIHHSKQYLAEADITPDYRITASSSTSVSASTATPRSPWPGRSIRSPRRVAGWSRGIRTR